MTILIIDIIRINSPTQYLFLYNTVRKSYVVHSQNRSERFRGKYGIETARLKNWDYGSRGYYFVTVCVKNRECVFGNVDDNKMIL